MTSQVPIESNQWNKNDTFDVIASFKGENIFETFNV